MPYLSNSSVYLSPPPPEEHFIIFRNPPTELTVPSWLMRSSLVDPDRERGAPVFDPDVTSVMDESRPADGKTQLFQLPIIWHSLRGCTVRGRNRQPLQTKERRHGGKVGHVLPRSQYVSFHWLQLSSSTFLSQMKLYTLSGLKGKCLVVVATHFQNGIIVGG